MTARERALGEVLGEPAFAYRDDDQNHRIDVHAFGRNFVEDDDVPDDDGYVLVTSGMSDRPMHRGAEEQWLSLPAKLGYPGCRQPAPTAGVGPPPAAGDEKRKQETRYGSR